MSDLPARADRPAGSRPGPRRPGGCLLMGLVVGSLMAFTVMVVVSLSLAGVIGGEGSPSEQERIRQEIEDETGIATSSRDIEHPPQRDLRLGACDRLPDGSVQASGTVTNYLGVPVDYELTVAVRAGSGNELGEELDRVIVPIAHVTPERAVSWRAELDARPQGQFTCKVLRIERAE